MDDYDPNSILIEDAIKKINTYEYVNLIDSHNRVIYENIKSKLKVPNYDNSAMDGYALNIKDLDKTKIFSIKGSSLAGKPYKGTVKKNECVRIMTGAVLPKNCNIVIMKEEITKIDKNRIEINSNNVKKFQTLLTPTNASSSKKLRSFSVPNEFLESFPSRFFYWFDCELILNTAGWSLYVISFLTFCFSFAHFEFAKMQTACVRKSRFCKQEEYMIDGGCKSR